MTDNELNRAIDKFMGVTAHRCCFEKGEDLFANCVECGSYFTDSKNLPNYCKDHNDVREFWATILKQDSYEPEYLKDFVDKRMFDEGYLSPSRAQIFFEGVMIQPRQLAEAGAKAVGIWKEPSNT